MITLTRLKVMRVYDDCIYLSRFSNIVKPSGAPWAKNERFIVQKLEDNRRNIAKLLAQLPAEFSTNGMPYILASTDAKGEVWCCTLRPMQQLFSLALASGLASVAQRTAHSHIADGEMPVIKVNADAVRHAINMDQTNKK